jgi:hypothetical protein
MSKRNDIRFVTIGASLLLCGLSWALAQQGPRLPDGAIQSKVVTACTECHESRIILQQRLSKAAWTKEVDKMVKWGAVIDAKDRDAIIDYLSTNFPPDKAPESETRTSKR